MSFLKVKEDPTVNTYWIGDIYFSYRDSGVRVGSWNNAETEDLVELDLKEMIQLRKYLNDKIAKILVKK